ncbi:GlsB/YeaQ/YmgE family stress response membrane protein [Proteiniclasticum sp. QWL-01]|uniref:GlsB/YeaQ/YmgE family stress response membrane protein n=1 Tax=Proteiniclasticum sp. QWL-01 TaxID=3036945 RepID=UPI002203DF8C|nr:GlsB/YeaQ/YmgE family stress response membrane protein [Proteiniclasticum sp. QWL-01]UUM11132.1 GlsB/YeaQ/YmgE family stress response membrane protein [Clostridiaceae bacterium HFYG-1003]WFF72472.1 GlsB/YeaQ/YmgE family stress response membrane protein [Proteiniclasticum sp. QWL-01]
MNDQKSLVMNIIVGIVGSFLGSWLASTFFKTSFNDFSMEGLLFSVIGAAILIFLKRLVTGRGF